MRGLGDGLQVVPLPSVVVHPTDHHRGEFIACLVDGGQPVFFPNQVLSFPWRHLDEVLLRVPAVHADLAAQGVTVAGKGFGLAHQLRSSSRRAVKADEQKVEVDRQAVHGHDFVRLGAGQVAQPGGESLVVAYPGVAPLKMSLHAMRGPIFQFDLSASDAVWAEGPGCCQ